MPSYQVKQQHNTRFTKDWINSTIQRIQANCYKCESEREMFKLRHRPSETGPVQVWPFCSDGILSHMQISFPHESKTDLLLTWIDTCHWPYEARVSDICSGEKGTLKKPGIAKTHWHNLPKQSKGIIPLDACQLGSNNLPSVYNNLV